MWPAFRVIFQPVGVSSWHFNHFKVQNFFPPLMLCACACVCINIHKCLYLKCCLVLHWVYMRTRLLINASSLEASLFLVLQRLLLEGRKDILSFWHCSTFAYVPLRVHWMFDNCSSSMQNYLTKAGDDFVIFLFFFAFSPCITFFFFSFIQQNLDEVTFLPEYCRRPL